MVEAEFYIDWRNISHKVKRSIWRKQEKSNRQNSNTITLLDNVSGYARSRELTAILGSSGAGKTTLLNCLFNANSRNNSHSDGQVYVEGTNKKLKVCVVTQNDYLNEWLTVREDLSFVSRLNNLNQDETENSKNVTEAAELLGLTSCLDVLIKNISGGEKKRLSLTRELMSRPDVLVLDEPTTGLDSLTCYKLVSKLKSIIMISKNPIAVIMTIHQPAKSVFYLLDKTYFLSKGGHIVYNDKPQNAITTIQDVGLVKMPSPSYNPASMLIEIASSDEYEQAKINLISHEQQTRQVHYDRQGSDIEKSFMSTNDSNRTRDMTDCTEQLSRGDLNKSNLTMNKFLFESQVLMQRGWLSVIRNPTLTKARLVFNIMFPIIMVLIVGDAQAKVTGCPILESEFELETLKDHLDDGHIQQMIEEFRTTAENFAFFYLIINGISINTLCLSASFYPQKINMLRKEIRNGLYSPLSFLVGQCTAEFPLEFVLPLSSALIAYYFTGHPSSYLEWRMMCFAFITFLFNYSNYWLGLVMGLLSTDSLIKANLMGQSFLGLSTFMIGFMVRPARMPYVVRIVSWFSHYQRGFFAIMNVVYGFNACSCSPEMVVKNTRGILNPRVRGSIDYIVAQDPKFNMTASGWDFKPSEIFDLLTDRYRKSLAFGRDIHNCDDVKPYVLDMYSIIENDLFIAIPFFLTWIILCQVVVFKLLKKEL